MINEQIFKSNCFCVQILIGMSKNKSFLVVFKKSALSIYKISPMILGILGLASLLMVYLKPENIQKVFSGNVYLDTIYGTLLGSLMLGNAIISYILGGELLKTGISMYAITAFLLSWTSIGYVQIPL